MSVAIIKDNKRNIISFIKDFIKREKLKLISEKPSSILAVFNLIEFKIYFKWKISKDSSTKGYKLNFNIESDKFLGTGLVLVSLFLVFFTLYSLFTGLIFILIYIFLILYGRAYLNDCNSKFFRKLEKEFQCSIESTNGINLIPEKLFWIIETAFALFLLGWMLKIKLYLIFFYLLFIFCILIFPHISSAINKNVRLNWRNHLVVVSGLWSIVLSSIVLFYIVLYYISWFDRNVMDSFENMIQPMRNFVFSGISLIIGTIIFILSFIAIRASKRSWDYTLLKREPILTEDLKNLNGEQGLSLDKITIVITFLLSALLHWIAAICAIDTLSYLINGKIIILKGLENIFLWLNEFKGDKIILPIVLVLCLPALISIFLSLHQFLKKYTLGSSKSINLSEALRSKYSSLNEICERMIKKHSLGPIIININENEFAVCFSEKYFKRDVNIINISKKAMEILELNELKAVLYHEIFHIIQGLDRIERSKHLSRLGMFPNYYLSLLYDLDNEEFEADKFVIKELEEESNVWLLQALYKIDINNNTLVGKSDSKLKKGRSHLIEDIKSFLFGHYLIGYSHPSIVQRLKNLEQM